MAEANLSHPTFSGLEQLPVEALLQILSETPLDNLYSLIRASPYLYQVFLADKAYVLMNICARELGPAIRDAIALASINCTRVDEAVVAWKNRLVSKQGQWLAGATRNLPLALRVVQIKKTAQFLVDGYVDLRFREFDSFDYRVESASSRLYMERIMRDATGPLSVTEHVHLSQAFIRRQAIVELYCKSPISKISMGFYSAPVVDIVLDLFEPWEKEQIAQADSFIREYCTVFPKGFNELQDDKTFRRFKQTFGLKKGANLDSVHFATSTKTPSNHDLYQQPSILRRGLVRLAGGGEPTRITQMMKWLMNQAWEEPPFSVGRKSWTFLRFIDRSESASPWDVRPTVPCNIVSQSPMRPPWAWTKALDRRVDRWGDNLFDCLSADALTDDEWKIKDSAETFAADWRWCGLVFWDKDRAEALTKGLLEERYIRYFIRALDKQTGWLEKIYQLIEEAVEKMEEKMEERMEEGS
ncbi:hypothetical protein PGQ11_001014 [Apiospora arundinis]|uniref:F-box domain-containing protein n=1 Tax=Apiospora arundinis TaxID=335852 RepID=A0ABR2JLA7_9PEZI